MFKKNTTDKGIELIYEIDENEKLDNVSIGMMKNNDIEALFQMIQKHSLSIKSEKQRV